MPENSNNITDGQFSLYLADLNSEGFEPAASDGSCPKCRSTLCKELKRKSFHKSTKNKKYYIDDYYDEVHIDSVEVVKYICKNCNQKYFSVNFSSSTPISSIMQLHIDNK